MAYNDLKGFVRGKMNGKNTSRTNTLSLQATHALTFNVKIKFGATEKTYFTFK